MEKIDGLALWASKQSHVSSYVYWGILVAKQITFFSETSYSSASKVMFTILLTVTQLVRGILWNTFDLYVESLFPKCLGNTVKCIGLTLFWSHQLPRKVIFSPTSFFVLLSHQWIWLADILQGKILGEIMCSFGFIIKLCVLLAALQDSENRTQIRC